MLKKFLNRGKNTIVLKKSQHKIALEDTSKAAREIVIHLQKNGHEAFIVGGCVRDIIAGLHPKDFDVATSATPEQIVRLFPRSRIIGRRFKIVHVRMNRELIEVTTFRSHHGDGKSRHAQQSQTGLLVRDNVYGDVADDAIRRDFTCNSLYYDPVEQVVIDRCGGVADLRAKLLRTIGDPHERFKEDPVRMIRAVRFQAKLGLKLDKDSIEAIELNRHMLTEVAPPRLFDEIIKLLLNKNAEKAFQLLFDYGLFTPLFPGSAEYLDRHPQWIKLIHQAMHNTADRISQDKTVAPFFLYAVLLWPHVRGVYEELLSRGIPHQEAMSEAADLALSRQSARITIPRRTSVPVSEVWQLQPQMQKITPKRAARISEHARFRGAYDFLLLRETSGENLEGLGQWWTEYQLANPTVRNEMAHQKSDTSDNNRRKRRRRPRKRKPAAE